MRIGKNKIKKKSLAKSAYFTTDDKKEGVVEVNGEGKVHRNGR